MKAVLKVEEFDNCSNILGHALFTGIGKNIERMEEIVKTKHYKEKSEVVFTILANGIELSAVDFFNLVDEHIEKVEKITDEQIEDRAKMLINDKMDEIHNILEIK